LSASGGDTVALGRAELPNDDRSALMRYRQQRRDARALQLRERSRLQAILERDRIPFREDMPTSRGELHERCDDGDFPEREVCVLPR